MAIFGKKSSPAMRKMEGNGRSRRFGAGGGSGFNISNVLGDPFSLATLGIAVGGWLMAFVSSVIADIDTGYPNFAWWTLVYMFFCIIGVFVTVATDSIFTYHVALTGFLSAGMVFTTSAVNSLIYYNDGSKEAGAAGFILLSIVAIVWIFYFGSQPQASHRQTIDSFALHKEGPGARHSRHMTQSYRPDTVASANQVPQTYNPNQLAGFETSSPVVGGQGGLSATRYSEIKRDTSSPFGTQANTGTGGMGVGAGNNPYQMQQPQQQQQLSQQQYQDPQSAVSAFAPISQQHQQQQHQPPDSSVSQPTVYPYRARAIYSYEANPDDPNEISFNKNEELEVSDVSGRWWQAKKTNGETGIAPSNYLILL